MSDDENWNVFEDPAESFPPTELPDQALRSVANGGLLIMVFIRDDQKIAFLVNDNYIDRTFHATIARALNEIVHKSMELTYLGRRLDL